MHFIRLATGLAFGLLVCGAGLHASAQKTSETPETAFPGNILEPETQSFPGNILDAGTVLFPGNILDVANSIDAEVSALSLARTQDRDALAAVYDRRSDLRKKMGELAALCQQGYAAGSEAQIADAPKMLAFQKRFTAAAKRRVTTPHDAEAWLKETHAATQDLILFQKEMSHEKH